jgi:hypothetical protein
MDQGMIAYFDERFGVLRAEVAGLREEVEGLRAETSQRLERMEETARHTQILVEGLRGDLRLVAEGVIGGREQLSAFRDEMTRELERVSQSIRVPYSELNTRLRSLEVWRETKERDPIDIIREKFGKTS